MSQQGSGLSHIDEQGRAAMVDISGKAPSVREALAAARVSMSESAFAQLVAGNNKKGDVLAVAKIAGIQAAKKCSDLIPLCHPLQLSAIDIDFVLDENLHCVNLRSRCKLTGATGVEMEALTSVSVAALTIYDMCKAVDKSMLISDIRLLEKHGGKSGDWVADQ